MTTIPYDPLFPQQWYLYNTGQSGGTPGIDLNVVDVWDDYTGRGVVVGVIDDGFDYTHYDLNNNYDTTRDYDTINQDADPFPTLVDENHGTSVAGIIGAEANGVGTVGVAFNATITGIRAIPGSISTAVDALWRAASFDVVNNSWGYGSQSAFVDNFFTFPQAAQAIANAVTDGRNGLGTAIVFSAGNYRQEGDNTNYHNFQNSRQVISVAALDHNGFASSYSTPGASILVSAFGSGIPGSIVTTDRQGSAGYSSGDYNYSFNGTSASAPQVSGVVALILEANRNLGYRDIQEILAYSARQNDFYNQGGNYIWQINGANNFNGGGLRVSHDYGFGLVDARAAVRLAETWQKQSVFSNEQSLSYSSGNLGLTIPDNNEDGITHTLNVAAGLEIDWVEVDLNLTHPYRGDLIVDLISPSGIASTLVYRPGNQEDDGDNIVFRLSSSQHWGESSAGEWTLRIRDLGPTDIGILNSWNLRLYGDADTANDTYFYTDEYGFYGTTTLTDTAGTDTINAAAITYDSYLNLNPGATSILSETNLTISTGTTIENAFTGDGNDTIIGNSAANILSGGRGNDILDGGAGNDTLRGGRGNDTYIVNATGDVVIENANEGTDKVQSSVSYTLGANVENLSLTGTSAINGTGNSLNNTISGNNGNNILNGDAGNDILTGGAGNDTLNGGTGNDTLIGGAGNDIYIVDSTGDFVSENANQGIDTVQSSISYTLGNGVDNLTLTGSSAINGTGNFYNNTITGNSGNNTLNGGDGNDTINGGAGVDTLLGGNGNDNLIGGTGNDTLTGGAGRDRFTFNSPTEGIDRITDFNVVDDTIAVSAAGFGGGLVAGAAIAASQFIIGTAATTASQRFIYNNTTGGLFFDQDGSGAIAKVQIATLNTGLALTNADIFVNA
ncbi:S8 family serine peptidase [Nostoc sp. FACHB-280]|uniref:S8 family serine peptidase n=1 Tax=Nostoc sp. FACHB-280 TaxID=2692839 RepID=UPI00168A960C|nr:S8 family serine peptidase [Nostoc sp. FACHB-280]MBD2495351.1 S8 family serine peptidase [Nostoc sp. FACHB-280]